MEDTDKRPSHFLSRKALFAHAIRLFSHNATSNKIGHKPVNAGTRHNNVLIKVIAETKA